jgi:hypothetical protein
MFDNCPVMLIRANTRSIELYRLELNDDAQSEICRVLSDRASEIYTGKTKILFNGSYNPREDEYFSVENFQLCDEIQDAICNLSSVPAYVEDKEGFPRIKAIFVGKREEGEGVGNFTAAFQCFRKEQYLSTDKRLNIFVENNVFIPEKRYGISISNIVDCLFGGNELQFVSYYFARQIFDLSDHYRTATDREVITFINNEKLLIENTDAFQASVTSWMRRKIAQINDTGVLDDFPAERIKTLAKWEGIEITIDNEKIVIPTDKEALKAILGFLAEEAYRGPFSRNTYIANIKRKV